jgi:hydrogenase maturation protein HypF
MTMCCKIREDTNVSVCALSGGVFQNRLLVRLAHAQLTAAGFRVLLHHEIPPNDGGICIGQALYGVFHS